MNLLKLLPLASLLLAGAANAQIATTTVPVPPVADAYVSRFWSSSNAGSATSLVWDNYAKPELTRTLIRFDTAAISTAIGTNQFVSAKLVFKLSAAVTGWGIDPRMDAFKLTTSWAENTVTWNSIFGSSEPFDTASPSARTVVQPGAVGQVVFDVSADVASFITGGSTNNGWVIKDDGIFAGISTSVSSREAASSLRPTLLIESVDATVATAAVIDHSTPGRLVIDASSGNYLEIPDHGLVVANNAALYTWLRDNLGFVLYTNGSTPVDAAVEVVQYGDTFYADPSSRTIVPVEDPVIALVGGKDGIITIGGIPQCIKADGCTPGMPYKAVSGTDRRCDGSSFCIKHEGIKRDMLFKSLGSELQQKEGGYHRELHFCWKLGFIPWGCWKSTGSNRLDIQNDYQLSGGGGWGTATRFAGKSNVESVKQRFLSVGGTIEIGFSGTLEGADIGTGLDDEITASGVCGHGNGSSGSKSVTTAVKKGNTSIIGCAGPDD